MASLPQVLAFRRTARVHLANPTPAVLRFQDGSCMAGNLRVISVAGGQLRLSQPLDPNTRATLMFLSDGGPVLGKAEMLSALSRTQQAFRFVALDQDNQNNLPARDSVALNPNSDEERRIAKYRSALIHRERPRRTESMKIVARLVAFGILVVVSAAYFLHFQY